MIWPVYGSGLKDITLEIWKSVSNSNSILHTYVNFDNISYFFKTHLFLTKSGDNERMLHLWNEIMWLTHLRVLVKNFKNNKNYYYFVFLRG